MATRRSDTSNQTLPFPDKASWTWPQALHDNSQSFKAEKFPAWGNHCASLTNTCLVSFFKKKAGTYINSSTHNFNFRKKIKCSEFLSCHLQRWQKEEGISATDGKVAQWQAMQFTDEIKNWPIQVFAFWFPEVGGINPLFRINTT